MTSKAVTKHEEQPQAVIQYSFDESMLMEMVKETVDIVEVTDRKTLAIAKKARLKLAAPRIAIEKERKSKKAQLLVDGRNIDGVAKQLKAITETEETRLKVLEDNYTAELERIEKERTDAIQAKIDAIALMTRKELDDLVENYNADDYAEFQLIASSAISDRDSELDAIAEAAELERIEQEKRDAEAKRLEEQRAEQEKIAAEQAAEREKLAAQQAEIERKNAEAEAKQRAEQEKIEQQKREIEQEKARKEAEEKAAIERARIEKEAKETAEREAKEAAERAEADRLRAEALRPDVEKIEAFANSLLQIRAPSLADNAAQELVNKSIPAIAKVAARLTDIAKTLR